MFVHWCWNYFLQLWQATILQNLWEAAMGWNMFKRVFAGRRRVKDSVFFNFVYVFFSKQTSLVLELWATNLPWLKSTRRITKAKGLKSRRVMMLYCKDWKDVGQQGAATTKAEYVQMILVWCCIWCMCKCAKSWKAWKIVEAFTDGLLKILTVPPTSFLRRMHRLRAEYVSLRLRRERCKHLKKN